MKKIIILVFMAMLVVAMFSGSVIAGQGSAPNSGDGVSDGSGMDSAHKVGEPTVNSPGSAPNSGDGIPDGSGF
jgi:hypothetical protein